MCSIWTQLVLAADCPDQDYLLSSQADVVDLGDIGCNRIVGDLFIEPTFEMINSGLDSSISDLAPLASITSVAGTLAIQRNPLLLSLAGLENISEVQAKPAQ